MTFTKETAMRKTFGQFMFSMGVVFMILSVLVRIYGLNPGSLVADGLAIMLSGCLVLVGALEMRR